MSRGGLILGAGALASLGGLAACTQALADHDEIYSRGADHFVLCSNNIDDVYHISVAEIADALDRARSDGTTLHLYTHSPGETIQTATLEGALAAASERGVAFITYEELSDHAVPGSLALSFDDRGVASWIALRPLFDRYHVQATFFVSEFLALTADERAQLHQLAADGHDIEYHSTSHLDAVAYAAAHGMGAYLADEIQPALQAMRADGYAATVFAYPFGARNTGTDDALAPYFTHLRAIRSTCPR
jgi:hypothetical protein